jgi:hypothetical protein
MLGIFQGLGAKNPLGGILGLLGGGSGVTGMLDNALYTQMAKSQGKGNLLGQLLSGNGTGVQSLMPIFGQPTGIIPKSSSGLAQDMLMPNGDVVPVYNQGTML